jgi:hypothetical protein
MKAPIATKTEHHEHCEEADPASQMILPKAGGDQARLYF